MFVNREAREAHQNLMEAIEERCGEPLCSQTDPELFFPEIGESTVAAKKLCRQCPVRVECLIFAMLNLEQHGIFGGLSPRERQILRRRSPASWAQHLREPEPKHQRPKRLPAHLARAKRRLESMRQA